MIKIYCVIGHGDREEWFTKREDAIRLINDKMCGALQYDYPEESNELRGYMLTHDETPDKYDYKYIIREVTVMEDYYEQY